MSAEIGKWGIILDVGGSSVKSGILRLGDTHAEHITKTPINSHADATTIFNTFVSIIHAHQQQIEPNALGGIAFGFPSPFDYDQGISYIKGLEKYEALYGLNIREALSQRLNIPNLPIVFRNDAECAVVGEALYGAGKPYERIIGVTLGTGMGSSLVAHGERVTQGKGVPDGGFLFPVPYRNSIADDYFSTRGILTRIDALHTSITTIPDSVTATHQGDKQHRQMWETFGHDLGDFLAPFAHDFGAEALVVGGGIAAAFDLFAPSTAIQLNIPVLKSALGETAPLLGAAARLIP